MAKRNDKRTRLVQAADKLFHEQGVSVTTLANIAQLADVPLGNVYYYFKSKESIIMAVVDYRRQHLNALFANFDQATDPRVRLTQLIHHGANVATETFLGDALGSLCQELAKQGGDMSQEAATLMNELVSWAETQFKSMGKGDTAKSLAVNLISNLQGMSLLGLTFKDRDLLTRQSQFLTDWILAQ